MEVYAFDRGHDCPAKFRERTRRYGGSESARDEGENGKKEEPLAAGEGEKEEKGGCVGM